MKMAKVILLRHGDYDKENPGKLNEAGRKTIYQVSDRLKPFFVDILGYVSNGAKSIESAKIIENNYRIYFEKNGIFQMQERDEGKLKSIEELLKNKNSASLLISNGVAIKEIYNFLGEKNFGKEFKKYERDRPNFGSGFMLDFKEGYFREIN